MLSSYIYIVRLCKEKKEKRFSSTFPLNGRKVTFKWKFGLRHDVQHENHQPFFLFKAEFFSYLSFIAIGLANFFSFPSYASL